MIFLINTYVHAVIIGQISDKVQFYIPFKQRDLRLLSCRTFSFCLTILNAIRNFAARIKILKFFFYFKLKRILQINAIL